MSALKTANLALAFFLELCMLVTLFYWGFQTGTTTLVKIVLGVAAPVLAIVVWGIWLAPRSTRRLKGFAGIALRVVIYTIAAVALTAAGRSDLAIIFAILVAVNEGLLYAWKQGG